MNATQNNILGEWGKMDMITADCVPRPDDPAIIGILMFNDVLIALAYYAIPTIMTFWFYKRGRRAAYQYRHTLVLFAAFILLCGMTHTLKAVYFYHPWYIAQAVVGFITGVVSLCTAVYLVTIVPSLLALPEHVFALEQGIQERNQNVTTLQKSLDSLNVLRDIVQDMRSVGVNYNGIVASFCNGLVRRAGAKSVIVFRDGRTIYSLPPFTDVMQVQVSASVTQLLLTLRSTSFMHLDLDQVSSMLGQTVTDSWYGAVFDDTVDASTVIIPRGLILAQFDQGETPIYLDVLGDVKDQLAGFLKQLRLIQQNEDRLKELAERNNDLMRARKETETASKDLNARLYVIGHELRTPVFAINALMNSLADTMDPEDLDQARRASSALQELVNEVLLFHENEEEIKRTIFDVRTVICDAVDQALFVHGNETSHVTVDFRDVPKCLEGDNVRIPWIVTQLTSNAIKFSGNERIHVFVHLKEPNLLEVAVMDRGAGIPPDVKAALAQAALDRNPTQILARASGGLGMGLSIAYRMALSMNGSIDFREPDMIGLEEDPWTSCVVSTQQVFPNACKTEYLFETPEFVAGKDLDNKDRETVQDIISFITNNTAKLSDIKTTDQSIIFGETFKLRGRKVLRADHVFKKLQPEKEKIRNQILPLGQSLGTLVIIDDNELNRKVMNRIARKFGYKEIRMYENGEAFFDDLNSGVLSASEIDVILMDIMMPKMDGFDTTNKIRKLSETTEDHPYIIVVTAAVSPDAKIKAMDSGANEYMSKNQPNALLDALRRAIAHKK